jgi:hypothetical protein
MPAALDNAFSAHRFRTDQEPIRAAIVFQLYDRELTDGQTPETPAFAKNSNTQDVAQDDAQNCEQDSQKAIAKTLVATRDPRKRCA